MKYIHSLVFLFMLMPLFLAPFTISQMSVEENTVFAAEGIGKDSSLKNPLKANSITELFEDILGVVMVFAVPIVVFFIVYAGFLYVTAGGNQETLKKATSAITYAIIGGLLILGAQVILAVIKGTVDAVSS